MVGVPRRPVSILPRRMSERSATFSTVSVAVVCMAGAEHLARCLDSLRRQHHAPDFEIVVACAPHLDGIELIRARFPDARIVVNEGQRTPLELASRAVRECHGELILLTKDHCIPAADWVHAMTDAQAKGRAVVGGRIEIDPASSAVEWAFHFIDFFRYAGPLAAGPAEFLSVCNASYKRAELDAVPELWSGTFVETAINDALRTRFGTLWLAPQSQVTLSRPMSLREAVHERYEYGRLFGVSRLVRWSVVRRIGYAVAAPALPVLMLGRMAAAALRSRRNSHTFMRSLAPLTLMVLARCWGEWLAYVTGRYPRAWAARRGS